jgi:UDP-glucose 4-epimerase
VAGRVFNVATGDRTTLLEAFTEIKRITGYSGDVNHAPERDGDIKHSLADISQAQKAFDYKVVADLAYGLEQTIEWAKESMATV